MRRGFDAARARCVPARRGQAPPEPARCVAPVAARASTRCDRSRRRGLVSRVRGGPHALHVGRHGEAARERLHHRAERSGPSCRSAPSGAAPAGGIAAPTRRPAARDRRRVRRSAPIAAASCCHPSRSENAVRRECAAGACRCSSCRDASCRVALPPVWARGRRSTRAACSHRRFAYRANVIPPR